jgi:hypothetical protein
MHCVSLKKALLLFWVASRIFKLNWIRNSSLEFLLQEFSSFTDYMEFSWKYFLGNFFFDSTI